MRTKIREADVGGGQGRRTKEEDEGGQGRRTREDEGGG